MDHWGDGICELANNVRRWRIHALKGCDAGLGEGLLFPSYPWGIGRNQLSEVSPLPWGMGYNQLGKKKKENGFNGMDLRSDRYANEWRRLVTRNWLRLRPYVESKQKKLRHIAW